VERFLEPGRWPSTRPATPRTPRPPPPCSPARRRARPDRAFDAEAVGPWRDARAFPGRCTCPSSACPAPAALDALVRTPRRPGSRRCASAGARFADLRRADVAGWLRGVLTARAGRRRWTATRRSASNAAGGPPAGGSPTCPASRPCWPRSIQWFFGLDRTPTVADGRVRVRLHLLAPNGRPGAGHAGPRGLLARLLVAGAQGAAGPLPQTRLAGGSWSMSP
jgi:hypothetical protein